MTTLEAAARRYDAIFHGPIADPGDVAPDEFPFLLQRSLLGRARFALLAARSQGAGCQWPACFRAQDETFTAAVADDDVLRVRLEKTGDVVAKSAAGHHDIAVLLLTRSLKAAVDRCTAAGQSIGEAVKGAEQ